MLHQATCWVKFIQNMKLWRKLLHLTDYYMNGPKKVFSFFGWYEGYKGVCKSQKARKALHNPEIIWIASPQILTWCSGLRTSSKFIVKVVKIKQEITFLSRIFQETFRKFITWQMVITQLELGKKRSTQFLEEIIHVWYDCKIIINNLHRHIEEVDWESLYYNDGTYKWFLTWFLLSSTSMTVA